MLALETWNTWVVYLCNWNLFVDVATCVVGVQGGLQVDSRTDKLYYWKARHYCIGKQTVRGSLPKTSNAQQRSSKGMLLKRPYKQRRS
jgi:hypothetical protein